jgi:predicted RNA binding protein YcfA (HicA-like mRNA interferase family)
MKVRDIVKLLDNDGWNLAETHGRHRQYKHPAKKGHVTIAGHLSHDLAAVTLNSVLTSKVKEVSNE